MDDIYKKIPRIGDFRKVNLVSGGISNQNYRIIPTNSANKELLLTLFPDAKTWWRADKEKLITNLYQDHDIPSSAILNIGYINHKNHIYRYLLREFVKEKDFQALLQDEKKLSPIDWAGLLTQLGNILGNLHSIPMKGYGLLRENSISSSDTGNAPADSSWPEFVDNLMADKKHLAKKLDRRRVYGNITGADIQNIFDISLLFYAKHREVLTKATQPFLIHFDILLENIIVNYDIQLSRWKISAIIDNEWASAGDPDIDLIQLENSAYFSSHKKTFKEYWHFFSEAYAKKKTISKDIGKKALIYHMMRSLFYLMEMYRQDQTGIITIDAKNTQKIESNYIFLRRLINSGKVGFSLFG